MDTFRLGLLIFRLRALDGGRIGLRKRQASETVYEEIRARIISGEISPNDRIDAPSLALRLGTSRTPIREALVRLKLEGLVEISRGKGIRVLPLSSNDIREIFQISTGIEMLATYLLTSRRPKRTELVPLQAAVAAMEDALKAKNDVAWADADDRFHKELFELSGNRRLLQIGRQLRDVGQRAHLLAVKLQNDEYKARSVEAHRLLLDVIVAGNPWTVMEDHFKQRLRGEEALIALLEHYGLKNL